MKYRDFVGSPVVKIGASTAGAVGLIPGQGRSKIPHTSRCRQKN